VEAAFLNTNPGTYINVGADPRKKVELGCVMRKEQQDLHFVEK